MAFKHHAFGHELLRLEEWTQVEYYFSARKLQVLKYLTRLIDIQLVPDT